MIAPFLVVLAAGAAGPCFEFIKIADTATEIPGRSETFYTFGAPSIDREGNVVFCGTGMESGYGLYTTAGGTLRVVADRDVPIPGLETTFAHGFRSYGASIEGGRIAFYAFTQSTELGGGVYLWKDGEVIRIADGSTSIPGGVGTFNSIEDPFGFGPFSHPAIDSAEVAFRASADTPRQRGIYAGAGGELREIADLETPVPGATGTFTFLSAEISIRDGKVAFRGEGVGPRRGIYTDLPGVLTKAADTTDPIPGGAGAFESVEFPLIDDRGRVIFAGWGAGGQQGIYSWEGGATSALADRSTPIPGGTGTFEDFDFRRSHPSAAGGAVLFRALGSGGQEGIYLLRGGSLDRVIAVPDGLDGKAVSFLSIGPWSLAGGAIAFTAAFSDGSSAVYIAVTPFIRGDANADGAVDLSDAVSVLLRLFAGGREPDCGKSSDADDSGEVEITDAVAVLEYLFLDGSCPVAPFPACGIDGSSDGLTCESYGPCGI
jgi:hypothetical protein